MTAALITFSSLLEAGYYKSLFNVDGRLSPAEEEESDST